MDFHVWSILVLSSGVRQLLILYSGSVRGLERTPKYIYMERVFGVKTSHRPRPAKGKQHIYISTPWPNTPRSSLTSHLTRPRGTLVLFHHGKACGSGYLKPRITLLCLLSMPNQHNSGPLCFRWQTQCGDCLRVPCSSKPRSRRITNHSRRRVQPGWNSRIGPPVPCLVHSWVRASGLYICCGQPGSPDSKRARRDLPPKYRATGGFTGGRGHSLRH